MSRLRIRFFRLLALSGITTISGSALAYYHYNLFTDTPVADCNPVWYDSKENVLKLEQNQVWDYNWDLCEPKKDTSNGKSDVPLLDVTDTVSTVPEVLKPTATRHIIFVRHGQYIHDKDDHFQILTDLGRKQASLTGERLKSLNIKFNKVVISTMIRAQETGELIIKSLPDIELEHHCSLLREGAPGAPYPKSVLKPELRSFRDNPRIEGAFRKYMHRAKPEQKKDSYELFICHANVIRYFICRSLQFPPEGFRRMVLAHCSLSWISIYPNGRVSWRGIGNAGHLPPNMVTRNSGYIYYTTK